MSKYPVIDVGQEHGQKPATLRTGGQYVTIVGALVENGQARFDNGVVRGESEVEKDVTFGPEVLRAMGGQRYLAIWLAAARNDAGNDGWIGLTAGEMRVDQAKKDGFKDVSAFQNKLADAGRGRVSMFQLKGEDRKALVGLLETQPALWENASRNFKETILSNVPEAASLAGGDAESAIEAAGALVIGLKGEDGRPARSLRAHGRDMAVAGAIVDGANAYWDNGVLEADSKPEKGVTFGGEVLRALGGRRVFAVWVSAARDEADNAGIYGVSTGLMRIDEAKKDGFKDLAAHGVKLNNATMGRIETFGMQPEEKKALVGLLKSAGPLWEHAFEGVRDAFDDIE